MALITQVINKSTNLADNVARYVKACAKRSVLEIKPLQAKINSKELGYICPNGDIQFQTAEAASKYAKNWVMQPLKSKNPYERFVAQHDNIIFYQSEGSQYSTEIDNIATQKILSRFDSDISIIHGHPNLPNKNFASPLSPNDCVYFHKDKAFKEIIAYDRVGNYSKFTKRDSINKLPTKFRQKFEEEVYPRELMQRQNELMEKMRTSSLTDMEEKEFFKIFHKCQKLLHSKLIARNTHRFWVNNAEKLGLDYSTNYSWLG